MFFLLLQRVIKRHFGLHLLIPLLVVVLLSAVFDWLIPMSLGAHRDWQAYRAHWLVERASELVGIYLSFVLVIALTLKRAGEVSTSEVDKLRDLLPQSRRYFAIGIISLREWFEPDTQLYLATIMNYQHENAGFRHERVLLFYTNREMKAVRASYLDERYATCFAAIHARFQVPLAYLGPEDLRDILLTLDEDTLQALGCHRRIVSALRRIMPQLRREWTLRRKPHMLPYALIEKASGDLVLRFTKNANRLALDEIANAMQVAAHKKLVVAVEGRIHDAQGQVKNEFKFANFLFPGFS